MTEMDWLVIGVGGVGGYALVSYLIQGPRTIDRVATTPGQERGTSSPPCSTDHLDKVAALGSELRELATAKSQDITEAYRAAMRARGESP